ncbi:MAG: hypothetical protein LQ348_007743, partial [Seirophora lacunosa]
EARAFVAEKGGWKEVYEKHLTPYRQSANTDGEPQSEDTWEHLTAHVTPALLTRFTQNPEWAISSASSGLQDRDEIPGLSAKEVGDARDRSWVVGDVVARHTGGSAAGAGDEGPWESVILGQMEVCFLMVLTLANYSCLEEWKRVLAVVLTCEKAVWEKPRFFADFLRLLRRQLERGDDVEGGLFDMSDDGGAFLKELLKRFNRTLGQRRANAEGIDDDTTEEFQEVAKWVKEQYGWELGDEFVRRGMLELEDGEMVEMETGEMAGEDESGETSQLHDTLNLIVLIANYNHDFRKDWQRRVRTHFDQPGRKTRRRNARMQKAAAVAPRPVDKLRPIVRCPSLKYNRRVRAGRGFSLAELKEAGIPRKLAPTIGISVDPRRANLSTESLAMNVERLKAYRARLILFPRRNGQHKKLDSSKEEIAESTKEGKITRKTGLALPIANITREEAIGEVDRSDMPEGTENAYRTLREARSEARLVGVREKRAKAKAEEATATKK